METKLFSPLLSSANNIVKMKRSLPKRARDYNDFIDWLDTSNKDIKKIKLPKKKKVEDLQFSVGSALDGAGGGGGGLLNLLLGGAAGLGARFLGKGIKAVKGFGKSAISKIFPKSAGSVVKKAAVPAADVATDLARKGVASGADDAAKVAVMKGGGKLASKGGELAAKLIPGLATAVNLGTSAYRFGQGDVVGGSLSLASAIPILGWAAVGVDVAREFGAFEGTPLGLKKEKPKNKIDERLKAQETKQREAASASNVTFESITDKFDKVVSKFEKLKLGMTGVQNKNGSNAEIEDSDSIEPTNPIDTGNKPEPTGLQLEDVEASGGEVPGAPDSSFRSARRPGHNGNDYFKSAGTPISLIQEGTVAVADMNWDPTGWGAVVEVRHKDGSLSRYAHLSKISVSAGSKISPGQVIGYTGGAVGAPGAGNSRGEHLHFEYLPAGSGQVDPTEAAKRIFRFGGSVKVKAKKGGNQGSPDPKINTVTKQQSIEDFIKGTKSGDRILNDPKLKAQLTGEKYQFKNTMVKTPVSDPEVKKAQQNYNAYVRDIRSRQQDQVKAQAGDQIPAQILTPPPTAAQQSAIFLMGDQSQQVASQPQVVPVAVPTGNGGGGVTVIMPSEGQILNSLWTTMLLTNLSSA
jgi:murein DD-endopeptidase MepM/ murein hydrolase activator NlpD